MDEEGGAASDSQSEKLPRVDPVQERWLDHPVMEASRGMRLNESFPRERFNLYAPLNLYCFFRMFQMLYQRLCYIKQNEDSVRDDVARASMNKPAVDLRISEKSPADFFEDTSSSASYYHQVLKMCEGVLKRNNDMTKLEETLRRFYLRNGWQLYSFDKMVAAIVKFAGQAITGDNKDRGQEIVKLFMENRKETETTHQAEINFRKQVEKLVKEGDLYRIVYVSHSGA
jgi:paired amphipathic helix protein Sin3a